MMDCQHVRPLLAGYLDRQLDPVEHAEVDRHLAACEDCRQALALQRRVRQVLGEAAQATPLPADLAARVRVRLPRAESPRPVATAWWQRPWLGLSIGALAGALVGVALTLTLLPPVTDPVPDEVMASHLRSLLPGHLDDVVSTDQHTVKPWFAGKLDFSPPVHDLAVAGFPLVGGRLDYLQQRRVAALVYRHRLHLINVYVWPSDAGAQVPVLRSREGYQLVSWRQEGMNFWAVSDLNGIELNQFAGLLQAQAAR